MKKLIPLMLLACAPLLAKTDYNFVIILADDLGWADVSPNNPNTTYETPNIQKLADNGVHFTQGYAPNPVCSPSRYSMQTGKYPTRIDMTNYMGGAPNKKAKFYDAPYNKSGMANANEISVANVLKDGGYKTFFAGKGHFRGDMTKLGYDATFGMSAFGRQPKRPQKYFGPFQDIPGSTEKDFLPDLLTAKTIDFIKANKNEKFFAFLSFNLVHSPYNAKPELMAKYKEKFLKMGIIQEGKKNNPAKDNVQNNITYAAMMETLDTCIGDVVKTLEEQGILDKTVVIFASDNGGAVRGTSNLPLRSGKGYPYEGGVRVPITFQIPNAKAKGEAYKNTYVNLIDIYPTICDLAGLKFEHKIDGVSLMPIIAGDESLKERDMFWHFPHYRDPKGKPSGAIRSGDWKLIENYEDGSLELYNLKEDISESKDLIKEYPQKAEEMKKRLHAWYKEVDAKFLEVNPAFPDLKPWRPE